MKIFSGDLQNTNLTLPSEEILGLDRKLIFLLNFNFLYSCSKFLLLMIYALVQVNLI